MEKSEIIASGRRSGGEMTVKEWKNANPDRGYTCIWAADAHSFGHKGGDVYGDKSQCIVIREESRPLTRDPDFVVLHVWHPIVCDPLDEGDVRR